MEQQVKLVTYGVADFATVIEQTLYYVDKMCIRDRCQPHSVQAEPWCPRFAKRIATLREEWQVLSMCIRDSPTPLQGKYQVLFLDFSQITGNIDKLETKVNSYLSINLDAFVRQYSEYYQAEMEEILAQEDLDVYKRQEFRSL